MKIVSACLAGINCRYDGKSKPNGKISDIVKKGEAIAVCPEELGGLPTPRPAAEQVKNKVINNKGEDITEQFYKGANLALAIAEENNCTEAILKCKSPMCGKGEVYDGSFSGTLTEGEGIFAKLLNEKGVKVITEVEFENNKE
ncbi:purine-nucleoside phosphorylase [archaeon]|nr:purine-nucleoside phosphorylase [archaeon]